MSATGYIKVHAYTSNAMLPLEDVAITVTAEDGTAIAMRLTDRSGLTEAIELPVPDKSDSQQPDPPETPYARVNLYAKKKGYEQIDSENIQIFADTTTIQNLMMIPLSELPAQWDQAILLDTPPQNL